MNRLVSRRRLLSQVGGTMALVPLLQRHRAWAAAPPAPRRLLILQSTNGVMNRWWPSGQDASFTLSDQLSPLEPYKSDLLIYHGLNLQVQMDVPAAGAGHSALPFLLTGANGTLGPDYGEGRVYIANAISVDQVVARAQPTPIKSLEMGAYYQDSKDHARSISFNGPAIGGSPDENPPEIDPYRVYTRLFQLGSTSTTNDALAQAKARKKSVLDLATNDLTSMLGRIDADNKNKVQAHLDSIRSIETELATVGPTCSLVAPKPGVPIDVAGNQLDTILKLQIDLAVTAFSCDLTRVASVMMMGSHDNLVTFPWLGSEFPSSADAITQDHHGIAHSAGDGADGGNSIDEQRKAKIDKWYSQLLAYAIAKLKAIPEGSGTMFDNTLILLTNHMKDGGSHALDTIPMITAGGSWYFKTGRYLQFAGKPHNGLLVAIANAMGVPQTSFGDPHYGGELPGLT